MNATLLKNVLFNLAIGATALAVLTAVPVSGETLFSLFAVGGLGCVVVGDYRTRRTLRVRLAARAAVRPTRRVSALVAA